VPDLTRYLSNEGLDNTTIVYFSTGEEEQATRLGLRLLTHFSQHPILRVTDSELALQLKLEPGKVYMYSKPSILLEESRSIVQIGNNANLEFIQAVEGSCRSELTVNQK